MRPKSDVLRDFLRDSVFLKNVLPLARELSLVEEVSERHFFGVFVDFGLHLGAHWGPKVAFWCSGGGLVF